MTGVTEERFRVTLRLNEDDLRRSSIVQNIYNRQYLPGPTFKGACRATVERWFRSLAGRGNPQLAPCVPVPDPEPQERQAIESGSLREMCTLPAEPSEGRVRPLCPACTLFGAQGLVGFIRVSFLLRQDAEFVGRLRVLLSDEARGWRFGKPRMLHGVAIDAISVSDIHKLLEKILKELQEETKALGSKPRRERDNPTVYGRVRVERLTIEPLDRP